MKQAAGLEPAQEDPFAGAKLTDGTYEAKHLNRIPTALPMLLL